MIKTLLISIWYLGKSMQNKPTKTEQQQEQLTGARISF